MTKNHFLHIFYVLVLLNISFCIDLIIKVKFTLSSISSGSLTWSVNETSTKENSILTAERQVKYLLTDQIVYLEKKVNETVNVCW